MRHRRPGPYQVQAAIAALHARAARPEDTDWAEIDLLYARARDAAAVARRHAQPRGRRRQGPRAGGGARHDRAAGRRGFPAISTSSALKGALLMQLGRTEEARVAFDRAIALANTAAEAAHIRLHLDRLIKDSGRADGALTAKKIAVMSERRSLVRPWGTTKEKNDGQPSKGAADQSLSDREGRRRRDRLLPESLRRQGKYAHAGAGRQAPDACRDQHQRRHGHARRRVPRVRRRNPHPARIIRRRWRW